jgi:hypothetical protein
MSLSYIDGYGWKIYEANGTPASIPGNYDYNKPLFIRGVDTGISIRALDTPVHYNVLKSHLPYLGTFVPTKNTAYWVYVGHSSNYLSEMDGANYVYKSEYAFVWEQGGAGVGAGSVYIALAWTPAPPNKANQTLTIINGSSTWNSAFTAALTGVNYTDYTKGWLINPPSRKHLWIGFNSNLATTQPTLAGIGQDMAQGNVLSTASAGAITTPGATFTGAIIAASAATIAPLVFARIR